MGRFKSNVLAQRPWHRPPRDSLDQDGRLSGSLAAFKFAISAGFEKNNIRDSFRKAFARRPILLFQKMRGWLSLSPQGRGEERTLSGLRSLQVEPRLDRLAHQEFLDLAGHGHREFVDEFHVVRDLVVCDLPVAEGTDLLGGQCFARANPDPGAELFAVTVVGYAKHLHVLDLGMAIEELLDLARIKVLAAADHHVLDAADDVAIALAVDRRQVTSLHP